MSNQLRPKPTHVVVCDLCGKEIPEYDKQEQGGLTYSGYYHGGPVIIPKTKKVSFSWPGSERRRKMTYEEERLPENRPRQYDFHAQCILDLVEANLYKDKK